MTADGRGGWFAADGRPTANLAGAIDLDLAVSPFTNTLPIRRCKLTPGRSIDIKAAYVGFPNPTISADPQRYTCLDARRYRYESLDSDFCREIEVDSDGLVLTYPGLFRRVL